MFRYLLAFMSMALALPALADTHVSFVDESGKPATQIYIKSGKVRIESGRALMIYDAASNTMTMMMPDKKQYLVLNQQAAAQMGAQSQQAQQQAQAAMAQHQSQMDQANAQMQAAMAKMSPQMQAQMQKMMPNGANPMAAMGPPQIEVKDLGTTETVAGHSCKDVQITINGRPGATDCLAPPDSLGIGSADLATLKAMGEGMKKMVSQMGPMAQGMSNIQDKGFAIKTQRQQFDPATMKTATRTYMLQSVTSGGISGDLFQIPAGYTQTSMEQMMAGHGH